jgi:beta-glucanase (GH16 family)
VLDSQTGRSATIGIRLILAASLPLMATFPAGADDGPGGSGSPAAKAGDRAADVHSGWTLIWNDEFDEPGPPNPHYWSHEVNCWGGGNNEHQCYTDRLDNSYVDDDGLLHIVAKEEPFSGPSLQDDDPDYPGPFVSRNYTSARLRTKNKVDWMYGRVEVRAQVPGGRGMWPAIWMLPTDWVYGGWPTSGEIDVFEAVNLARDGFGGWGNVVHGTLHYGLPWPQWENHGQSYSMNVNPADGFHEYAIEWERDQIRWYVDGLHYQTQSSKGWYNYVWGGQETGFVVANDEAPFDQLFHLILNVAVGGDWPGWPDRNWDEDREMLLDYVRLYQCARGSSAGMGRSCGTIDPAVEVHRDIGTPGINDYVVYDDGFATLVFEVYVNGEPTVVENTLVPASFAGPGVTVDRPAPPRRLPREGVPGLRRHVRCGGCRNRVHPGRRLRLDHQWRARVRSQGQEHRSANQAAGEDGQRLSQGRLRRD